jgi:glucosamine--fructose-6-phosphate aminotransferase (isomerizing)
MFVIGRGLGLGIAQEAALKLKETCGLHAEAISAAELRHGPLAIVCRDFPVMVFSQHDATLDGTQGLIADLVAQGACVLSAGAESRGAIELPARPGDAAIEPILQIQTFYRLANALAITRGLDPDRPVNLAKVTETL